MTRSCSVRNKKPLNEYVFDHLHSVEQVFPTLAGGTVFTKGAAAWAALPAVATLIPANTANSAFDLRWLVVENASQAGVYEVAIYENTTNLIATVRLVAAAIGGIEPLVPVFTPLLNPANTIDVAISGDMAVVATLTLSAIYHEH